jgi:hypothetical protein
MDNANYQASAKPLNLVQSLNEPLFMESAGQITVHQLVQRRSGDLAPLRRHEAFPESKTYSVRHSLFQSQRVKRTERACVETTRCDESRIHTSHELRESMAAPAGMRWTRF